MRDLLGDLLGAKNAGVTGVESVDWIVATLEWGA
jgi:hypothetical protein